VSVASNSASSGSTNDASPSMSHAQPLASEQRRATERWKRAGSHRFTHARGEPYTPPQHLTTHPAPCRAHRACACGQLSLSRPPVRGDAGERPAVSTAVCLALLHHAVTVVTPLAPSHLTRRCSGWTSPRALQCSRTTAVSSPPSRWRMVRATAPTVLPSPRVWAARVPGLRQNMGRTLPTSERHTRTGRADAGRVAGGALPDASRCASAASHVCRAAVFRHAQDLGGGGQARPHARHPGAAGRVARRQRCALSATVREELTRPFRHARRFPSPLS
jgi:hypothetical protein